MPIAHIATLSSGQGPENARRAADMYGQKCDLARAGTAHSWKIYVLSQ